MMLIGYPQSNQGENQGRKTLTCRLTRFISDLKGAFSLLLFSVEPRL